MKKINNSILSQIINPREPESYKGNYGRVLIIAGSTNFEGAAIMSSSATIYSGAGLVTVATIPERFVAINTRIPEAMTIDYHDTDETLKSIQSSDVIVIGPGLSTAKHTQDLIDLVIKHTTGQQTIIFDASALTVIAEKNIDISQIAAHVILTPHQGEWQRLSNLEISEQTPKNNLHCINQLAPNALLIVKKHHSEIYYQNDIQEITDGNPGMATGGMGDTLTGIIAAFVGQFGFSLETVSAALYLHSYVADKIFAENYVVLPEKLIQQIPRVMHQFSLE